MLVMMLMLMNMLPVSAIEEIDCKCSHSQSLPSLLAILVSMQGPGSVLHNIMVMIVHGIYI